MLDAISDFWKPMRKSQGQEKLQPEQLQVGSSIGFGFVPQPLLSGRRLQVVAINTYRFGEETLTSFALAPDKDPSGAGISMIVAEADGEQYLAISRRMTISDRMKMFDSHDLENVLDKPDITHLPCKDGVADFKGWTVASYKREMQGLKGVLFKGDFRKSTPPASEGQEFKYTLLVSGSNEHAIEIEQYSDGRMEVYATIYRRMSDIGEVIYNPATAKSEATRPDLKLASKTESKPAAVEQKPSLVSAHAAAEQSTIPPVKAEPIKLQELPKPAAPAVSSETKAEAPVKSVPVMQAKTVIHNPTIQEEKKPMQASEPAVNGRADYSAAAKSDNKPKMSNVVVQPTAPESYIKQEVKAVSKATNGLDNEAIECDLRVANKIIDEAIRNEMRLSDIVRRIIELPVAYPEAVQIPITLSDEDYSLLAIRYGISASDRNSIKRRIMEDLNDFSGESKKKAA